MRPFLLTLLGVIAILPATSQALGLRLADPGPFRGFPCDARFADRVVRYAPATPLGDARPGLDGSAALCGPDDIGFFPEPDSDLSVALGTGGWIELAFANVILNDGVLAPPLGADSFPTGFELLIFEDGELDGASFFGRLRTLELVFLGSVAEVADLDPTAPGAGTGWRDTAIGIDLDAIFDADVELISLRIVDDGITEVDGVSSGSFEADAVMNRSPGGPTPDVIPEPGTLSLVGMGLTALAERARRRRPQAA